MVMLWVLPVRRHVGNLKCIDRSCLVSIVISNTDWLHKTLKVLLKVGVKRDNIICVIAVLGVKTLSEKVDIANICLDRHFKCSASIVCRVRTEFLEVENGLVGSSAWLLS